jgi:hypothetical protein
MRYLTVSFLLVAWLISIQPAKAIDWPTDLNSTPAANRTNAHAIETFLNQVLAPDAIPLMGVGGFRFVPLETGRRIDLIATVALSGRGKLNALIAVWQSPNGTALNTSVRPVFPFLERVKECDNARGYNTLLLTVSLPYGRVVTETVLNAEATHDPRD